MRGKRYLEVKSGLHLREHVFRQNLHADYSLPSNGQEKLRCTLPFKEDPPLIAWHPTPVPDVGGYFGAVWKHLAVLMKFNYTAQYSVDGQWGGMAETGRWTGVVGMLERREVDAGVTTLLATEERRRAVSFTSGLITLRYRIFLPRPSSYDPSWTTYLSVFSGPLWAAAGATVAASAAGLSAMFWLERRHLAATVGVDNFGWGDTAMYCIGAACQQGADRTPAGLGTRLFFWLFYITMVTTVAAYSATLVSSLAVERFHLPFHDMEAMVADGSYKLAVSAGSSMLDYFKFSPVPTVQEVYKKHLITFNFGEGSPLDKPNVALFTVYNGYERCDIVDVKHDYYVKPAAIGLQKNSPYQPFFNFYLRRLQETGVMDRLQRKWLSKTPEHCQIRQGQGLGLSVVASAFLLLAGGLVLSLGVLITERCFRSSCRFRGLREDSLSMYARANTDKKKDVIGRRMSF